MEMMEAEPAPWKKGEEIAKFSYQFSSNGTRYHLRVPVRGPLNGVRARELASRLVRAHNLPCYLEDELCSQLEEFARDAVLRQCDKEGDELVKLAGDSVAVEVSEGSILHGIHYIMVTSYHTGFRCGQKN